MRVKLIVAAAIAAWVVSPAGAQAAKPAHHHHVHPMPAAAAKAPHARAHHHAHHAAAAAEKPARPGHRHGKASMSETRHGKAHSRMEAPAHGRHHHKGQEAVAPLRHHKGRHAAKEKAVAPAGRHHKMHPEKKHPGHKHHGAAAGPVSHGGHHGLVARAPARRHGHAATAHSSSSFNNAFRDYGADAGNGQ